MMKVNKAMLDILVKDFSIYAMCDGCVYRIKSLCEGDLTEQECKDHIYKLLTEKSVDNATNS